MVFSFSLHLSSLRFAHKEPAFSLQHAHRRRPSPPASSTTPSSVRSGHSPGGKIEASAEAAEYLHLQQRARGSDLPLLTRLLPGAPLTSSILSSLKLKACPKRDSPKLRIKGQNSSWQHPQPRSAGAQAVDSTGLCPRAPKSKDETAAVGVGVPGHQRAFSHCPQVPRTHGARLHEHIWFTHWGSGLRANTSRVHGMEPCNAVWCGKG